MSEAPRTFDAVLFDLDGTLIDSIRLILDSYHHTFATHGLPAVSDEEHLRHLGKPLADHLAAMAPDPSRIPAMVETYRSWNRAEHDRRVRAYDGVPELVGALAESGVPMAVVTSKIRSVALRGLEVAGLVDANAGTRPFEFVLGADDVARHKPDPEPVLRGAERLGVDPARVAYVGDSPHDMCAASAAGAVRVAVGWGPFERSALEAAGYDHWLDSPADLAARSRR